ncbi:hypothetical protein B0T26DRAFT_740438 [Lasiosphaeria miniovina]|uniref:DNA repair protein Rad26 n=1 Tax=Lasiosphaeria miniovina TaxID=1954250 RepID=A0AA40AX55_9PEZI|nr:uncharacterized protein B0T26DRAFT_740438 [Lasiosphaeria miniovina]KAK0723597.1 hypothetical protein B0T26DRAFT_740438 [Lasiosphaeria miniovina]
MDEYSDDGFDDLNDNTLQELENNAIQFTQAQKPAQSQFAPHAQAEAYGFALDDDDLDDTVVIDELAGPLPRPHPGHTLPLQQPRVLASLAGQQSRPSYPPRPNYPSPSRPAPRPLLSQRYPARPAPQPSQFARPPVPIPRPYQIQPSQALQGTATGNQNDVITALQARLSVLEAEATAARGEAAILRSKFDKVQTTHDAEVARLKKQSAEQAVEQKRQVEAAKVAERTLATELHFVRQDREELGRVKTRKRDGPTTPKKNKVWGLADGFDGIEIMSSPTRGEAQKRKDSSFTIPPVERTPTKGKRKRPAVDSPTFALETHSEELGLDDMRNGAEPAAHSDTSSVLPYDFLKLVLDHSALHGQSLTFDLLSRFAFPSTPLETIASVIFQKLPQMGSSREPLRLLADFSEFMIDLWQQCLSEKYHAPIYYLAALVSYTLQLNTIAVAPHVISSLIPLCTTTCRLVALPRFNSVDGDISNHPDQIVRQLYSDIDVTQCLSLLYLAALGCFPSPSEGSDMDPPLEYFHQVQFWKSVELEFILMMLSPKHPEPDWFGALSLLWTSVLPHSIGPIPNSLSTTHYANGRAEAETPESIANMIIDRVSSFLAESPRWATPGSAQQVNVRSAALRTMMVFATSPFGAMHIANSEVAIPRLVTVLCWAIDRLYDMDVQLSLRRIPDIRAGNDRPGVKLGDSMECRVQDREETQEMQMDLDDAAQPVPRDPDVMEAETCRDDVAEYDMHRLLCRFIAQAMLLLHTLVTDSRTANIVNMTAKLAASHGGAQRYLLTLARLNFAEEDLILEAGIDADTVELAHELLELAVTPDEGEGVGELFV